MKSHYPIFTPDWELLKVGPERWNKEYDREVNDPTESVCDSEFVSACITYEQADAASAALMRGQYRANLNLILFAQRAAVRAIRERKSMWIDIGLVALSLEDAGEIRDSQLAMAFLEHASWRLSYNLSEAADRIAHLSSSSFLPQLAKVRFRGVPRCSPLARLKYVEIATAEGPSIIHHT
jgi:hypothetical protein